jgi:hypothetical protein
MEMTMVAVVAAIVISAVVTTIDGGKKGQADLAGDGFEADVAYARNLSITRPDDPIVIKVDPSANRYWLAASSAPDTPIIHPQTGSPYVVQFGPSGKSSYQHVNIVAYDFGGDNILRFDGTGSTDQATPAVLQLSSDGAEYEVNVAPASAETTTNSEFTMELTPHTQQQQVITQ